MTYVVVGGGLAGAKAVETLRDEGYTGPITLISTETDRPYERPPLSKGLLLGTDEPDSPFVHEADWYASHDVDLRLGTTVTAVDRSARVVRTDNGDSIAYEYQDVVLNPAYGILAVSDQPTDRAIGAT